MSRENEREQMQRDAERFAASMGKVYRPHPGGPVDWETGEPLRREVPAAIEPVDGWSEWEQPATAFTQTEES